MRLSLTLGCIRVLGVNKWEGVLAFLIEWLRFSFLSICHQVD